MFSDNFGLSESLISNRSNRHINGRRNSQSVAQLNDFFEEESKSEEN